MTPDEIRAAIAADTALQALVPDTSALAAALSEGRTTYTPTEVGVGTIIEVLGLAAGNALLDVLTTAPDFRHIKPLLDRGALRLDSPFVRGTLQTLVTGSVLTQAQADALIARSQVDDPVSEFDVRCAIYADDGTLRV